MNDTLNRRAAPTPIRRDEGAGHEPQDGVRWLALVLAEVFRVGLALIGKRYPDARGTHKCPKCGWRA